MKKHIYYIIVLYICFLNFSILHACSIPVFRYALEHWLPDSYDMVILHQGEFTRQDSMLLENLNNQISNRRTTLNLFMKQINLTTISRNKIKSIIQGSISDKLPVMAIWYPGMKGHNSPLWTGAFSPTNLNSWLNSPKRKELAERLIGGDSAVWLFLESGDTIKDSTAYFRLKTTLDDIIKKIKKYHPIPIDVSYSSDYSYQFSILRLSKTDTTEKYFYHMLISCESDLEKYSNEPIVFPIYGRGRVLYALVGEGISTANIEEAAMFITGPCGCQIKMLNPGIDLLIQANWEKAIFPELHQEDPSQEMTRVLPDYPTYISREDQSQSSNVEESHSNFWINIMGSFLVLILIVIIGTIYVIKKGAKK